MAENWEPSFAGSLPHAVPVPIWTGLVRWVFVPSPSWPLEFKPHAWSVPSPPIATVWELPQAGTDFSVRRRLAFPFCITTAS